MTADSIVVLANTEYFRWQSCSHWLWDAWIRNPFIQPWKKNYFIEKDHRLSVRASYLICFVRPCSLPNYFVRAFCPFFKFVNFKGWVAPSKWSGYFRYLVVPMCSLTTDLRSNRQKLSTVRAYYPGILVSILTSNFVTDCLLKVRILWQYPGIISSV